VAQLDERLAALEAAQPVEHKPPSPWPMIMHKLVAFHLGSWTADTRHSPAEHYALAAGWTTPENRNMDAMQRAMGSDEYSDRHRAVVAKMFAARGVNLDGDDHEAVARATYELCCEAEAGGMALPELAERAA
jgi:hypothetical protein